VAADEDDVAVLLHGELDILEVPRAVLERVREGLGTIEPEPLFRNL
jgi:hypothetical protein